MVSRSPFRTAILAVAGAILAISAGVAVAQAAEEKPQLVWVTSGFWTGGELIPSLALYEDGSLIYSRTVLPAEPAWIRARLEQDEHERLIADATKKLADSRPCYFPAVASDMPAATLYLQAGDTAVVAGYPGPPPPSVSFSRDDCAALWSVVAMLRPLSQRDGRPFEPESMVVTLHCSSSGAGDFVKWPLDWPDLDDEATVHRSSDSTMVFLEDRGQFDRLFKTSNGYRSAAIGDEKCHTSRVRSALPGESIWQRAIIDSSAAKLVAP
jgi:hypothetical protein